MRVGGKVFGRFPKPSNMSLIFLRSARRRCLLVLFGVTHQRIVASAAAEPGAAAAWKIAGRGEAHLEFTVLPVLVEVPRPRSGSTPQRREPCN